MAISRKYFLQLIGGMTTGLVWDGWRNLAVAQNNRMFDYRVITVNERGEIISQSDRTTGYLVIDLPNNLSLEMVSIPKGSFLMGSPVSERGRNRFKAEEPLHKVDVGAFYLSKYPITQEQWRAIALLSPINIPLNPSPGSFLNPRYPVDQVSWAEANEFVARMSRLTQRQYRLPSEAEWEYATRADTNTPFYFGRTITSELANYNSEIKYRFESRGLYRQKPTVVGSFPPNNFGLYDLHGNVWEWCADLWHDTYENAPSDGGVWMRDGVMGARVIRGGAWFNFPWLCRSASRFRRGEMGRYEGIGFRIAM